MLVSKTRSRPTRFGTLANPCNSELYLNSFYSTDLHDSTDLMPCFHLILTHTNLS
jgi:hypothetical protein